MDEKKVNRTRSKDVRLLLSENEMALVDEGMKKAGLRTRSSYLRKVLLGHRTAKIVIDMEPVFAFVDSVHRASKSIERIEDRVADSSGHAGGIAARDISELRGYVSDIKNGADGMLKHLTKAIKSLNAREEA